jgi:hypothetical protein
MTSEPRRDSTTSPPGVQTRGAKDEGKEVECHVGASIAA